MKRLGKPVLLVLTIVLTVYLVFFFPGQRRAPSGAPGNYYEVLEQTNEIENFVYLVRNTDLLPAEFNHTYVGSVYSIPEVRREKDTYVIIDFDYVILSDDDILKIDILYDTYNYKFILLNYNANRINTLDEYLDIGDEAYDFIVLESIGDLKYSAVVISDADSNIYQKQYEIMHYILNAD